MILDLGWPYFFESHPYHHLDVIIADIQCYRLVLNKILFFPKYYAFYVESRGGKYECSLLNSLPALSRNVALGFEHLTAVKENTCRTPCHNLTILSHNTILTMLAPYHILTPLLLKMFKPALAVNPTHCPTLPTASPKPCTSLNRLSRNSLVSLNPSDLSVVMNSSVAA